MTITMEANGQRYLLVTEADVDADGYYAGDVDLGVPFEGHIRILQGLGVVRFRYGLNALFSIEAGAGTSLDCRTFIEAGEGIKVGGGLYAAFDLIAGLGVEVAGSIIVGEAISAGWGVEAGGSIQAGLSITAEWLSAGKRIFAGLSCSAAPDGSDMQITAEVRDGVVGHGTVVPPDLGPPPALILTLTPQRT